ncbi:MAG: FkbM family methyltransferase [Anaerolineae bacterium]|nr:FkbM family methyltransferase [Anaerolineae bacterium]
MAEQRFYGQNGEDCLLWAFFGGRTTGFYVDVGAFDGRYVSNTYAFEKQGWKGICVEPHPVSFEKLTVLRDAICLNTACVADESTASVTLYIEKLGFLSGLQGSPREDDVRRRHNKRGLDFDGFETVTVPATTLANILGEHLPTGAPIDFLSLDVEGTEIDVLRGLDLNTYQPRVLVIEANTRPEREALTDFLAGYGYRLARTLEFNAFFVRDEQDAQRLRAISVDCQIEPTPHPFGDELTPPQHATGYPVKIVAEAKPAPQPSLARFARRVWRKLTGAR